MGGYSILYLGRSDFAPDYMEALRRSPDCARFSQSESLAVPAHDAANIDLIVFEADRSFARDESSLAAFVHSLRSYPLVALTRRDEEQRGIAAVRAGAQGYLCIDGATDEERSRTLEHAIQRHRLLVMLSADDSTVLSILNSINDGAIVVDRDGHVMDINPAARALLGLSARQLPDPGWDASFCTIAADGAAEIDEDERPLVKAKRGGKFAGQLATYRAPGQRDLILNLNGQGLYAASGELIGGVVTFRDVTDQMRRTLELEQRAQYDELTGLANRRLFVHLLEKAIGRAQRGGKMLAVLFVDLDKFKSVNDTLGHDAGDELIRRVAGRMSANLRVGDVCGRWGGDEFVVCLEDFGEEANTAAVAQKLILALSEKYDVHGSEVYVTPSIGIAVYPESGELADKLIKAADLAMFQAKKRGGSRFQFYSGVLNTRLEQREELELGLRHALVRKEFVLHYQPRIDVATGRLIGLEALLRWQHPRYGLLPPARFLNILEASGLIHSAGEWVVDTAFRQLATWQHRFELPDLSLAINLSPQQLRHGRLVETVRKTLENITIDPGCIDFEIRDGIVRQRSAELETLHGLRRLGVRLSLDHFGTHEVSFNALDTGVIDSFVLDQSLIQDVDVNDSHRRIVRAAIAMARGLDIEVAAEGVETITQLEFLRSCNCDLAQGFLISRPIQPEKVSAILRSEIAGTRLLSRGMP